MHPTFYGYIAARAEAAAARQRPIPQVEITPDGRYRVTVVLSPEEYREAYDTEAALAREKETGSKIAAFSAFLGRRIQHAERAAAEAEAARGWRRVRGGDAARGAP